MSTLQKIYRAVNPINNRLINEFACHTDEEVNTKLDRAWKAFRRNWAAQDNANYTRLERVAQLLEERKSEYASLITLEMGKPLAQAEGEVLKCADHARWMIENVQGHAADEQLQTSYHRAFVQHAPIGPLLNIVPWNFPFWMPFKSMTAPLLLGCPILLKPAPSTPMCGAALNKLFEDAGFDGEFQTVFLTNEQAAKALGDKRVRGVKFTGSTQGGKAVAAIAGSQMKQGVYELGGSDPFVVLEDSDIEMAVNKAYTSRMMNNAQACINAKRFIISEAIYDQFKEALVEKCK